jgi:hypothetical protein
MVKPFIDNSSKCEEENLHGECCKHRLCLLGLNTNITPVLIAV